MLAPRAVAKQRFNEAAGIPRGRPDPANASINNATSFNEAAGIPRGRPVESAADERDRQASMRPRVFPRGRLCINPDCKWWFETASMRPRVFPAEDF